MTTRRIRVGAAMLFMLFAAGSGVAQEVESAAAGDEQPSLVYRVTATQPRLNRRVMGQARRFVRGVPAEPVDSMTWNGVGSTPIEGRIELEIDPVRNVGFIVARWSDRNGQWFFRQTRFTHPDEHPSGVRMSSSVYGVDTVINEPVVQNVYLHGDTTAGAAVLPTVFTHLATWGPSDVFLDGTYFESPFETPAPCWEGHLMVTEGVRHPDGTVRTLFGGIYNPMLQAEGIVEEGDLEVHLVFHDDQFPMTSNIPPLFSFFYHLVFEEVKIEIVHGQPRAAALGQVQERGATGGLLDGPLTRGVGADPGVCSTPVATDAQDYPLRPQALRPVQKR